MSNIIGLWRARAWLARKVLAVLAVAGLALAASPARAQDDPPGRVGRLAELQGGVSWYDHEQGQWSEAERNRPLTTGDRLSTGPQGRAELRVGSTVLRLAGGSELEVLRLDDERMSFQLHAGSLALRIRSREVASEIDLVTAEARLQPERAGHYRVDRIDDTTQAGVWRGTIRIDDPEGFILETGQRAELWRAGRSLRFAWSKLPGDALAEWVAREDQRYERSASSRHVSPEMTGAEDLDRYGRWEAHPEYGALWFPLQVGVGWAPYRQGHWAWVRPWGWTWVDEAPWGFAPFHYGRWVHWGGRWGWAPGERVVRPVYAPALVAWVGGGNFGVSVQIGGPPIGWVPLAPRDWYVPHHRHTPVYVERVNPRPPPGRPGWQRPSLPPSGGPVVWGNQSVPGAVTVVPREVLVGQQPVGRGAIDTREWHRGEGRAPLPWTAPPQRDLPSGPSRDPREPPRERDRDAAPRPAPRGEPVPILAPQAPPRPPSPTAPWADPPRRERPRSPERERDRERDHERERDRPAPAVRPMPAPAATQPQAPAAPAPAQLGAAATPVPGPSATPAPGAAPTPRRGPPPTQGSNQPTQPAPTPERAREREERERVREDDRKRAPEGPRGAQRQLEREK